MRLKPLDAQVMVITGATSGIGLVTARLAARAGAKVFLIARDAATLAGVAAGIERSGGRAAYAAADVGNRDQLRAAAQAAVVEYGGFDTWVNVAGVAIYAPLLQTPRSEHERLFQTNYWGVVNGCEIAVEHFKQKGTSQGYALITVGSILSDIGTPLLGAYAASKHAVKGFIDSLRIEVMISKIPVSLTLVKPSGVGSPLAERAANHDSRAAKIPPPAYSPEAVARAVLRVARSPRRELIVGGAGALQVLAKHLMPNLVDRMSMWIIPLIHDPRRAARPENNLDAPLENGAERSAHEVILQRSLYTDVAQHRTTISLLMVIAGGFLWLHRSKKQPPRASR